MQWWFCLIHQLVEEGTGCPNASRLGPYDTHDEAATVLERIHARESTDEDDD